MTGAYSNHHLRYATADDARALATVHVRGWQESYREILPAEFLDSLDVEDRAQRWVRTLAEPDHFVLVATNADDRVVGFCDAGANRDEPKEFQGEVYAIYLLAEAQGRGLGRALFEGAAAWLRQSGRRSFLVWVFARNTKARGFYEALGGTTVREKAIIVAGASYTDVAYGWLDG